MKKKMRADGRKMVATFWLLWVMMMSCCCHGESRRMEMTVRMRGFVYINDGECVEVKCGEGKVVRLEKEGEKKIVHVDIITSHITTVSCIAHKMKEKEEEEEENQHEQKKKKKKKKKIIVEKYEALWSVEVPSVRREEEAAVMKEEFVIDRVIGVYAADGKSQVQAKWVLLFIHRQLEIVLAMRGPIHNKDGLCVKVKCGGKREVRLKATESEKARVIVEIRSGMDWVAVRCIALLIEEEKKKNLWQKVFSKEDKQKQKETQVQSATWTIVVENVTKQKDVIIEKGYYITFDGIYPLDFHKREATWVPSSS